MTYTLTPVAIGFYNASPADNVYASTHPTDISSTYSRMLFSVWGATAIPVVDGESAPFYFSNSTGGVNIIIQSALVGDGPDPYIANHIYISAVSDTVPTVLLNLHFQRPVTTEPSSMTHWLISVDLTTQTAQVYENDVACVVGDSSGNESAGGYDGFLYFVFLNSPTNASNAGASSEAFTYPNWYSTTSLSNNASFFFNSFGQWCLADLYFAIPGSFYDLSVEANRRAFINSDLTPVDLGTDASSVLGTAPPIYLTARSLVASDFLVNNGTGGSFSGTATWGVCSPNLLMQTMNIGYAPSQAPILLSDLGGSSGDASIAITGVAGTGAAGTPANMSDTASITSAFGMGEAGTPNIGSNWSMVIAGIEATGTADDTASDEIDIAITGVSGPGETGSRPLTETVNLVTGVEATGAAGNPSIEVDCLIIVGAEAAATGFADEIMYLATGVEATGEAATPTTETDQPQCVIAGVEGTGAADASAEIDIPITGVEATGAAGDVGIEIDCLVGHIFGGAGVAGSPLIQVDDEAFIIGVFGTGIKGHPLADVSEGMSLAGVTATGAAGLPRLATYKPLIGVSTIGQLGAFTITARLNPRPRVLIMSY